MSKRCRSIDQRIEHLVIPGGGHADRVTNGLLLRTRVPPPLPLEVQDCAIPLSQVMIKRLRGRGDVHERNGKRGADLCGG